MVASTPQYKVTRTLVIPSHKTEKPTLLVSDDSNELLPLLIPSCNPVVLPEIPTDLEAAGSPEPSSKSAISEATTTGSHTTKLSSTQDSAYFTEISSTKIQQRLSAKAKPSYLTSSGLLFTAAELRAEQVLPRDKTAHCAKVTHSIPGISSASAASITSLTSSAHPAPFATLRITIAAHKSSDLKKLEKLKEKFNIPLTFPCGEVSVDDLQTELEELLDFLKNPDLSSKDKVVLETYKLSLMRSLSTKLESEKKSIKNTRAEPVTELPEQPTDPTQQAAAKGWKAKTLSILKRVSHISMSIGGILLESVDSYLGTQAILVLTAAPDAVCIVISVFCCVVSTALYLGFEGEAIKAALGIESLSDLGHLLKAHKQQLREVETINRLMQDETLFPRLQPEYSKLAVLTDAFNSEITTQADTFYTKKVPVNKVVRAVRWAISGFGLCMQIAAGVFLMKTFLIAVAGAAIMSSGPVGWIIIAVGVFFMAAVYCGLRGYSMVAPGPEHVKYESLKEAFNKFDLVTIAQLLHFAEMNEKAKRSETLNREKFRVELELIDWKLKATVLSRELKATRAAQTSAEEVDAAREAVIEENQQNDDEKQEQRLAEEKILAQKAKEKARQSILERRAQVLSEIRHLDLA